MQVPTAGRLAELASCTLENQKRKMNPMAEQGEREHKSRRANPQKNPLRVKGKKGGTRAVPTPKKVFNLRRERKN